jgi:hypothetical protein
MWSTRACCGSSSSTPCIAATTSTSSQPRTCRTSSSSSSRRTRRSKSCVCTGHPRLKTRRGRMRSLCAPRRITRTTFSSPKICLSRRGTKPGSECRCIDPFSRTFPNSHSESMIVLPSCSDSARCSFECHLLWSLPRLHHRLIRQDMGQAYRSLMSTHATEY